MRIKRPSDDRASKLAAVRVGALRLVSTLALIAGMSASASHGEAVDCDRPEAPKARAAMLRIESDFRSGSRIVRMQIDTHYREGHRLEELYKKDRGRKTLWGVIGNSDVQTNLLYVFSGPGRLAGTTLLMHDRKDSTSDDGLWLYLRAFDSFSDLASSAQQVYVPGTALSYEDSRGFIPVDKYRFSFANGTESGDAALLDVIACPATQAIAQDLGYGHLLLQVDPAKHIVRSVEYRNLEGEPLKRYTLEAEQALGQRWFAKKVTVEHLVTGMVTPIAYEYWAPEVEPDDSLFEPSIAETKFLDRLRSYLNQAGLSEQIDGEIAAADAVIETWKERWGR